jgi:CUB/sushi domain-containing protein
LFVLCSLFVICLKQIAIDCGSPGIIRDGFLSGERFDYPNIIAFFCNDGYKLSGKDTTRACQENGLWSGTMPFCQSTYDELI